MGYRIEYRRAAVKYLERLVQDHRRRILSAIEALGANPDSRTLDIKRLHGRSGFRLRVGDYRILYERHDEQLVILVVTVRPRGEAYKE